MILAWAPEKDGLFSVKRVPIDLLWMSLGGHQMSPQVYHLMDREKYGISYGRVTFHLRFRILLGVLQRIHSPLGEISVVEPWRLLINARCVELRPKTIFTRLFDALWRFSYGLICWKCDIYLLVILLKILG
jgi:hypothetical protein